MLFLNTKLISQACVCCRVELQWTGPIHWTCWRVHGEGGQCFWSHLSTCFVLTFVKEENHGRRKERGWWRNETGFGNVSADRWWRLMELGRVPRYCQSIALISSKTLHVFRCDGSVLVLFRHAFRQVCHDSFIFASIHLSDPYVIKASVELPHQTDFKEYKLALKLAFFELIDGVTTWVTWDELAWDMSSNLLTLRPCLVKASGRHQLWLPTRMGWLPVRKVLWVQHIGWFSTPAYVRFLFITWTIIQESYFRLLRTWKIQFGYWMYTVIHSSSYIAFAVVSFSLPGVYRKVQFFL